MKQLEIGLIATLATSAQALAHPGHAEAMAEPVGHWVSVDHLAMLAAAAAVGVWYVLQALRSSSNKQDGGCDG